MFEISSLKTVRAVALGAMVLSVGGCASSNAVPVALDQSSDARDASSPPSTALISRRIKHVVIIIQENRSFDNLFAGFPNANAPMIGLRHDGHHVALRAVTMDTPDLVHSYGASLVDYDGGKMDGFNLNRNYGGGPGYPYSYVERSIVAPYWIMAKQYTLADAMFSSEHGDSWTAHINLIGTTNISPTAALIDNPTRQPGDCFAPRGTDTELVNVYEQTSGNGPFPCFTQFRTLADTLDAAGISWRYYAAPIRHGGLGAIWSAFATIKDVVYTKDWHNVVVPPTLVLSDIAQGHLANVTWVTPDYPYSDHSPNKPPYGPSWVASIVNAVGTSPFWKDTAIIVLWDEWGGYYDNAVPPQLDFKGLGLRVPCIIISPYARRHHVSHTQYEYGSILRFVEEVFRLPLLGTAADGYDDARANSISDSFNFAQQPLRFTPIPAPYPPTFFLQLAPSLKAPDDD
jgi:phospholipase C